MQNLSDHIHDLVENSVEAKASRVDVMLIIQDSSIFDCIIKDNGIGIKDPDLNILSHPFTTGRKTRRQGLGLGLIRQNSENCGGSIAIHSQPGIGTELKFSWDLKNIDCLPIGELPEVYYSLIRSLDMVRFVFELTSPGKDPVFWDSDAIRDSIYPISLHQPDIQNAITEYLNNSFEAFNKEWNKRNSIEYHFGT